MTTIKREDLDAGRVDLRAVTTGEHLAPVRPGDILAEEFMLPMGISARALARDLGVPANRITAVIKGERAITADTALRLSARFGTTAEFWLGLQMAHDLEAARQHLQAA